MGDAKQRKESDPNYGRLPKHQPLRGLVVSSPVVFEGNSMRIESSALDPQELRFALLFWDRLVWPSNNFIRSGSGADGSYLENAGILTRPEYTINGEVAQAIARGHIQAYLDRERDEPGGRATYGGTHDLSCVGIHAAAGAGFSASRVDRISRGDARFAAVDWAVSWA